MLIIKEFIPCEVDIKVKDGDVVKAAGLVFEVIHVPGHTPGSVFISWSWKGKLSFYRGYNKGRNKL